MVFFKNDVISLDYQKPYLLMKINKCSIKDIEVKQFGMVLKKFYKTTDKGEPIKFAMIISFEKFGLFPIPIMQKIGKIFYTDAENSLKLIECCRKSNRIILGIETFRIFIENRIMIQPNMKDDIYYSKKYEKLSDGNYHWDVAEQFINDNANKGLVFEVDFERK